MSDVYQAMRDGFSMEIPATYNFAYDLVEKRAKEKPEQIAYIAVSRDCKTVKNHTYGHLNAQANRFANGLRKLGCKKGDFACVVIARLPAWYEVLVGAMKIGVVSMPGTNLLTAHDLEYRINRGNAKIAIVTAEHAEKIEEIKSKCPSLEHFIIIGEDRDGWVNFETLCAENSDELSRADMEATGADDLMLVYFTSGTTSLPKMVPRDFSYGMAHEITGKYWMGLKDGDVHWTLTDTGWAKAAWGMLFPPMLMGATILLYDGDPKFDAETHLKLIERFNVGTFCAPPTVYRVFAQMDLSSHNLSSLNHCIGAGEPLNPEVMRVWKKATGCDVYDGYGQTETINIVANFKGMEVRPGSMGKPVPGISVDITDDEGNICDVDTVGHISVKVTDPYPLGLFTGYYKDEVASAKCFKNGWYFTGDTATRDKDGYIWFVGRSDDIIGSAGYRISPFEVESALIEHPAVAESAVVAKPDAVRGEIVKAYVTLSAGYEASDALCKEIQDFVKKETAPYKYPREIEFRDALPKTISGKIRRVELREEAKAET